jgi:hypothetical protein
MNTLSLTLSLKFYDNFRPCIVALTNNNPPLPEVYGKISINIPDKFLPPNQFFVKTYSENQDWARQALEAHPEWFTDTKRAAFLPHGGIAPVYELTNRFIAEQFELTYNAKSDIYEAEEPLWELYKLYCEV